MAQTQLDKLNERIAKAKTDADKAARKAKVLKAQASTIKRRQDTKMKILYGAALMKLFEADPSLKQRIDEFLPKFLTRDSDRATFGLEPLQKKAANESH